MNTGSSEQLRLLSDAEEAAAATAKAKAFDPARLTQARLLAGMTKQKIAETLGVSAAAVGQWEAAAAQPRPDHLSRLAELLEVPIGFFAAARPHARLDASTAHFRSLRSTPVSQRAKAVAFVEQVWELTYALEKRVLLPPVDLPGFAGGEVEQSQFPTDPIGAARSLRIRWGLGTGPIPHLVRTMENHGIVVTLIRFAGDATAKVDAFSTSRLPRPIVVLTPDRANDVYRYRFTAAHELGHLLLHGNVVPGDPQQEQEANIFAAELLTPREQITPQLPIRVDLRALSHIGKEWGVSVDSLLYRCREVGSISEPAFRRACQRLRQLRNVGLFPAEPVQAFPGEMPVLLTKAAALAEDHGYNLIRLANELAWPLPRLRMLLGGQDPRPTLRLL